MGINTKLLKKEVKLLLEAINITDIDIVSCRFCTSRDDTLVTLNNIVEKIKILDNFKQYPVTFDRVSNDNNKYNDSEVFYNKFCKYTIGISQYASNILILGELGRFPISVKSAVLGIQYWLHLEHTTENIMHIRKSMHGLKILNTFFYKHCLQDIWFNPNLLDKNSLKCVLTDRLQDIYM